MKDKTIDYILRATWQAVARMYNEEAAKYNATMATGFALLSIDRENGSPSTTLGPKMGMEATSLTRTLKSMEERGLITRKKNPTDGRGVIIQLTKEGKEIMIFKSIREASRVVGVKHQSIIGAIKRNGTSAGYKWEMV